MGFGTKYDHITKKTLDLDKTYKNIIKPAVKLAGFNCVRADEIQDSGLIDKSMYALLMHADLVIADISTFNPNAIYELGIRHAVRPYSTIIIKEEEGKIPFDLDHTRILHYKHLGEDIGTDEAIRCQTLLAETIAKITKKALIDSPLYDFIKGINPPELPANELKIIMDDLVHRESHLFAIVEKAKNHMIEGEFVEASKLWGKAVNAAPTEDYYIQQQALSVYKSKNPSEITALTDALNIIEQLSPDGDTNDPETLGLTGAIYKRMWLLNDDVECLKRAINYYGKGFQIRHDYYTGENYALCLNMLSKFEDDENEKIYNTMAAKKARKEIIKILEHVEDIEDDKYGLEFKWALATLSNCYYGLGDDVLGLKYENLFLNLVEADWEAESFQANKNDLFILTRS